MTKKYWSLTALTLIVVVGLVIAVGGASVAQAVYVGGAHNGILDGTDYNDDGYTQTVETVTPVGACPGETVTVTGTATPGETVTVVIALERETNWGDGSVWANDNRYEITLGTAQAGVSGGWSLSAALPTTVVRTSDYMQVDTPAGDWRITLIGLDGYMSDGFVTVLDCGQTPPPPGARDYFWTWYDNVGGRNWVLLANPAGAANSLNFSLSIAADPKALPNGGVVGAGSSITPSYPGVMGGPVKASSLSGDKAIVSQRILWADNSLEEVLGADAGKLSDHFYWTWYDQLSSGYTNWVLVANPSDSETVHAVISFINQANGALVTANSDIAPGANWTPTFAGKMGGPVEVKVSLAGSAWPTDPRPVIASQRVLSGYGSAFNEVPGIPATELSNDYLWTWYDNLSAGFTDWVLVANPNDVAVTYQIKIADQVMPTTADNPGAIPAHGQVTPTFPGQMNGPVEVTATGGNIIASQRVIAGPSFEEVPGYPLSALASDYHWTWYDQLSAGSTNWVLVANPGGNPVTYQIKIAGVTMPTTAGNPGTIPAYGQVTPTFPGQMNGPVEVIATGGNVMVSQRVMWNGFFNEVLGTVLN